MPAGVLVPDGLDATLVLVRHGESVLIAEGRFQGQMETPLTATGLSQAALAARRLANPHDAPALPVPAGELLEIVHSPLGRTTQTAAAIAGARASRGAPARTVRPDPGFLEIAQGAWEGLPATEIRERYGDTLAAWRRRPLEAWAPGGESLPQVAERVRPALRTALERLAEGRPPGTPDRNQVAGFRDPPPDHPWSIVVGHDGAFKIALLTLFDLPLDRFWMWSMDLCGITVIELRAGRPVLRAHNLTAHLAALLDDEALAEIEDRGRTGAL
ncbi:MAG: histidine phosphatase family protein [Chloroflexi bacterium]|nr:histidine phosphatase family protein [Chloroflexota bacterium]